MESPLNLVMNNNDIAEVSVLIRKDLSLDNDALALQPTMEEFKEKLIQIIRYFLDKEFERLLQAMYRIDINENKLKIALASDPPENVASTIADLIIERELQKVETRRKYRQ